MRTIFCVALLCLISVALTQDENPGVRVRVTQKALDGFVKFFKTITKDLFKDMPIIMRKKMGKKMKIHKIEIKKDVQADIQLKFQPPNQLALKTSGGDSEVTIDMTVKKPRPMRGKMTVIFGDLDLDLAVAFTKKEGGKLGFTPSTCNINIGKFSMSAEGFDSEGAIARKVSMLSSRVKTLAPQIACPQLKMLMSVMQIKVMQHDMQATIPLKDMDFPFMKFKNDYFFDYALTSDPKATDNYMEMDMRGAVYASISDRSAATPFNPAPLVDMSDNSRMIHLFLSDEVPNQIFRELNRGGDNKIEACEPSNNKIKAMIIKHKEEMGWDVLETDDIKAKLEIAEPPTVNFLAENEKKNNVVVKVPKLILHVKHIRDGEELSHNKVAVSIKAFHSVNVENSADQSYPKIMATTKITDFKVLTVETKKPLTDSQKTLMETGLKTMIQGYFDKKNANPRKPLMRKKLLEIVKLKNAYMKFFKTTMELATDIDIDEAKFLEKVKKGVTPMMHFF